MAAQRIRAINPDCRVEPVALVLYAGTPARQPRSFTLLRNGGPGYVVDAVDTVTAKLEIIGRALAAEVPVISSMGTGNKLHPELLELTTLEKTTACRWARVMRRECRARGYKNIPVVYSTEPALTPKQLDGRRRCRARRFGQATPKSRPPAA